MLIQIISYQAERAIIRMLEEHEQASPGGLLLFEASTLSLPPQEEDLLRTLQPVLGDYPATIYLFSNRDIAVAWKGPQKETLAELCKRLYDRYAPQASKKLHSYFDLNAQGEELRMLCKRRMPEDYTLVAVDKQATVPTALAMSPLQQTEFKRSLASRKNRRVPHILIVEDQAFSTRLLMTMLDQKYKTFSAMNAAEALELYSKHAPDLVFLDIELPDHDGHQLAKLFNEMDSKAYIIMVTANHLSSDVMRAKENKVKGFIVKPYNKLKIQECLDKFTRSS